MSHSAPSVPAHLLPAAKRRLQELYDFELEYLVQALRRDLRSERERVVTDPTWADSHRMNMRHAIHLLEILNPKTLSTGA